MTITFQDLGWSQHFAQLHDLTGPEQVFRVTSVHRDRVMGLSPDGEKTLIEPNHNTGHIAVGDWVLTDDELRITARLDRKSLLQRRAAGREARAQLIAANVDTLFIVSSCNADFNVARLERYLALAQSTDCFAVIVLTKADLCEDVDFYRQQIRQIPMAPPVEILNAKDPADIQAILAWVSSGQTAAILGSSGVGKTTLANGMTLEQAPTGAIRDDDAKGRHTTTSRHLRRMNNGGWLIDTPGMRELQLFDAQDGIEALFEDLFAVAQQCKFSNCAHESEPGCAIKAGVEAGDIDPDRLNRWRKLMLENQYNNESVAQTRSRDRSFGRMVNTAQRAAKHRKGRK
ncbi:MAG: ribosome small subunit-dependent GTPase A [Cognatishimia sp.]